MKFVERLDDGTTRLNFSPIAHKVAAIVFATASALTVIVAMWDFIRAALGG